MLPKGRLTRTDRLKAELQTPSHPPPHLRPREWRRVSRVPRQRGHAIVTPQRGSRHAELAIGAVQAAAQEFEQALVGDPAELLQELAVVPEVDPQHDGQAEDVLTVRNREGNRAGDELPEEQDFLLMA